MDQSPTETLDERVAPAVGSDGALDMRGKVGLQVTRVDRFTAAGAMPPEEHEMLTRRFSTLLVDPERCVIGGVGRVEYAEDIYGAPVAVKTTDDKTAGSALAHEYEVLRMLSGLRGFSHVHGFGHMNGQDAVLMEWVEGMTLDEALPALAGADGTVPALTTARIGRSLFELIERMSMLERSVVHRDISPSNIMIDTTTRSLEEQIASGRFDLRLVDFGSAVFVEGNGCTTTYDSWEGATRDFAAPEMLADDERSAGMRENPAVDVYAAARVLLFLLEGRAPRANEFTRDTESALLSDILAGCLDPDPAQRPSAAQVVRELTEVVDATGTADVATPAWQPDESAPHPFSSGATTAIVLLSGLVAAALFATWLFRRP